MATRNAIADALETVLATINTELEPYSEPDEKPGGAISCEIYFQDRERKTHGASAYQREVIRIEMSTPAHRPGWGEAVRRMRSYLDYKDDANSIEKAFTADKTLGGVVKHIIYDRLGSEELKTFADGDRWTASIFFRVDHKAD